MQQVVVVFFYSFVSSFGDKITMSLLAFGEVVTFSCFRTVVGNKTFQEHYCDYYKNWFFFSFAVDFIKNDYNK